MWKCKSMNIQEYVHVQIWEFDFFTMDICKYQKKTSIAFAAFSSEVSLFVVCKSQMSHTKQIIDVEKARATKPLICPLPLPEKLTSPYLLI